MLINLDKVKVAPAEAALFTEKMSNWDKCHAWVSKMHLSAEDLLKMLKVETKTRRRVRMSLRLLGMYHRKAGTENTEIVTKALAK